MIRGMSTLFFKPSHASTHQMTKALSRAAIPLVAVWTVTICIIHLLIFASILSCRRGHVVYIGGS